MRDVPSLDTIHKDRQHPTRNCLHAAVMDDPKHSGTFAIRCMLERQSHDPIHLFDRAHGRNAWELGFREQPRPDVEALAIRDL
jgi:hypothetical protein